MLAEIVELGTKLTGGVFIAEVDARFELVPWLLIKALNIEYDGVTDGVVMEELVDGIARYNKKRRGGLPGGFPGGLPQATVSSSLHGVVHSLSGTC